MEAQTIIKKLQLKDQSRPVLILNSPGEYNEIIGSMEAEVHTTAKAEGYHFVQVFGTSNEELRTLAKKAASLIEEDGLLWLSYPKKSSKKYKGSDCNRDEIAYFLGEEGFEPVRMVAIDENWSALRFRDVDKIKKLTRKTAATAKGKKRVEGNKGC